MWEPWQIESLLLALHNLAWGVGWLPISILVAGLMSSGGKS